MERRGERLVFVGVLAGIGAVVIAAWLLLFGRGPGVEAEAGPPPAGPPPVAGLKVLRVAGEAWLTRPGAARARLSPGMELFASDVIETAEDGGVDLGAGERYEIAIEGAGRLGVSELASEIGRFRLDEGLAAATVKPDAGGSVVIESSDDAAVRTSGGKVRVAASGGRVAVGVTEGEAQLGSGGQIVAVRAGQFSVAEKGKAPSRPVPLPKSLLLKVDWPGFKETNRSRVVLSGRTSPGALVSVGGERVKVKPDGSFSHVLRLREGRQVLEARARDVVGRIDASASPPVVLDTRAPDTRFDTRDLWGKQRGGATSAPP